MNRLRRLWMVITTHRPVAIATAIVAVAAVLGLVGSWRSLRQQQRQFLHSFVPHGTIKHVAKLGPGIAKIACQACHVGGRHPGLGLIIKGLFGSQSNVARHAAFDETTCISCHATRSNAQASEGHSRPSAARGAAATGCLSQVSRRQHTRRAPNRQRLHQLSRGQ